MRFFERSSIRSSPIEDRGPRPQRLGPVQSKALQLTAGSAFQSGFGSFLASPLGASAISAVLSSAVESPFRWAASEVTVADSRVSGSCFCGAVRFDVGLPTLFCGHCHCSMCRRSHGAAFVTWFAVSRSQFVLERGQELARFRSSDHGTRSFCSRCGSTLFCESTRHPDRIDIVLANMEDPIDRLPQVHIYFDDRAEWTAAGDDLPRLGGSTGLEPITPDPA